MTEPTEAVEVVEDKPIDPRLIRLRVELYTAAQLTKGHNFDYFVELIREISAVLDFERETRRGRESGARAEPLIIPPVERTAQTTTDGRSADDVRFEQRVDQSEGKKGQHKSYIVLTEGERSRGFVRPVRRSYKHEKCGATTTMGLAIAETYARDPGFYGSTMCTTCNDHYPVGEAGEFTWPDGSKVGT